MRDAFLTRPDLNFVCLTSCAIIAPVNYVNVGKGNFEFARDDEILVLFFFSAQPIYLCPVDLHKLQQLCGFDAVDRYQKLLEFFKKHGMEEETRWFESRLAFITESETR